MSPSERIKHIKAIASALSSEEWLLLDLTLKQFGLPWTDQWGGTKEAYVIEMVAQAEDGPLLELAKHLGVASQLETTTEPAFWGSNSARVFLSHLASMKASVTQLRVDLAKVGISAFVAHDDIEPTKEWQTEIGLRSHQWTDWLRYWPQASKRATGATKRLVSQLGEDSRSFQ